MQNNHADQIRERFGAFAEAYLQRFGDQSAYASMLSQFLELLPEEEHPHVLDIGCGPGNVSHFLLQERQDLDLLGIDFSEPMINLARKVNPQARFEVMDCRELNGEEGEFDGIICSFCFPYLDKTEVRSLIRAMGRLLPSGGPLYLSLLEDDHRKSGLVWPTSGEGEPMFTYYHQADYLMAALNANGFKITELKRFPEAHRPQHTELLLLALKTS